MRFKACFEDDRESLASWWVRDLWRTASSGPTVRAFGPGSRSRNNSLALHSGRDWMKVRNLVHGARFYE